MVLLMLLMLPDSPWQTGMFLKREFVTPDASTNGHC
jgi:hypothetical protein